MTQLSSKIDITDRVLDLGSHVINVPQIVSVESRRRGLASTIAGSLLLIAGVGLLGFAVYRVVEPIISPMGEFDQLHLAAWLVGVGLPGLALALLGRHLVAGHSNAVIVTTSEGGKITIPTRHADTRAALARSLATAMSSLPYAYHVSIDLDDGSVVDHSEVLPANPANVTRPDLLKAPDEGALTDETGGHRPAALPSATPSIVTPTSSGTSVGAVERQGGPATAPAASADTAQAPGLPDGRGDLSNVDVPGALMAPSRPSSGGLGGLTPLGGLVGQPRQADQGASAPVAEPRAGSDTKGEGANTAADPAGGAFSRIAGASTGGINGGIFRPGSANASENAGPVDPPPQADLDPEIVGSPDDWAKWGERRSTGRTGPQATPAETGAQAAATRASGEDADGAVSQLDARSRIAALGRNRAVQDGAEAASTRAGSVGMAGSADEADDADSSIGDDDGAQRNEPSQRTQDTPTAPEVLAIRDLDAINTCLVRQQAPYQSQLSDMVLKVRGALDGNGVAMEDAASHWTSFAQYARNYLGGVEGLSPLLDQFESRGVIVLPVAAPDA